MQWAGHVGSSTPSKPQTPVVAFQLVHTYYWLSAKQMVVVEVEGKGGCICSVFQWSRRHWLLWSGRLRRWLIWCAREKLRPWTLTPLTQLPVGNSPPREVEGQSSRVSRLAKTQREPRVQTASGLMRKGGTSATEPCKDNGKTSKVNLGGQVLKNLLSSQRFGCITILYTHINISPNCAK